jgi:hypothetical protein
MVVAIIARSFPSVSALYPAIKTPYIIADLLLDDIDQDVEEWNGFDHHGSVTTRKDTATARKYKLRYYATVENFSSRPCRAREGTHDMKNIDTPRDPKPSKTGFAGNLGWISYCLDMLR